MSTFNDLPDELYRHIYKYLNPISKASICFSLVNLNWCNKCGEYLKNVYYLDYFSCDYICQECYIFNGFYSNS